MLLRAFVLLLLTACCFPCGAQDLTGTWEGQTSLGITRVKLVLVRSGNNYVGYCYEETKGLGACTSNFIGRFYAPEARLKGGDRGTMGATQDSAERSFDVRFEKGNGTDFLSGSFNPRAARRTDQATSVPVRLTRSGSFADTTQFMRRELAKAATPPPAASSPAPQLEQLKRERRNDVIQEIATDAPVITIRVYDNGVFDGDTVSILHNNTVIADHKVVTVNYFEFTVRLDEGDAVHDITLIAHNVGTIPPNTASLTIIAGEERYRLTASTDLGKNAVVRFRYRKTR